MVQPVSFYSRYVLPTLLDLAMRNGEVVRYRRRIVPQASGVVLEVGVGSGLNFPFYGADVQRIYAIDPSAELLQLASPRSLAAQSPVELLEGTGQALPLPDALVDTAVITFTLCTVGDPERTLSEIRRVLKPGGTILFAEHGQSPDASVRRWQQRLNPAWRRITGGCNLDRRIDALLESADFELTEVERGYARGPRPMAYIYSGRGQRTRDKEPH